MGGVIFVEMRGRFEADLQRDVVRVNDALSFTTAHNMDSYVVAVLASSESREHLSSSTNAPIRWIHLESNCVKGLR